MSGGWPERLRAQGRRGDVRTVSGPRNLGAMRRQKVSDEAMKLYEADATLAGRREELLATAHDAEDKFRHAQAQRGPVSELRALAEDLDSALTAAMQAAYAAQRAEIGARGYDDRIYRRKRMATPAVHALTAKAEHLLTLRETHRLNGIPDEPLEPAV
jgi:hypothetical protein